MHRAKIVALCLLVGLVVLVAEQAIFVFLIPHDEHFAPELGPAGAFMVFTAFFSVAYVLSALIVEFTLRSKLDSGGKLNKVVSGSAILAVVATLTCAILMASTEIFSMLGVFALPALAHSLVRSRSRA
jgi:hypothetical protein